MCIKIAITEDHPMVIQGLQRIFSNYKEFEITAVYKNGKELQKGLATTQPDVLILDIQLPDKNGDELMVWMAEHHPDIKVLILTNFESPMYIRKMSWLGTLGYLSKTADASEVILAVKKVYNNESYIEQRLRHIMEEQGEGYTSRMFSSKSKLTLREKEILQMVVEGLTDQEIAAKLFLSFGTIQHYRKNLLLKLDVKNTASLVAKALKTGLAQ